jgi:hypothetical protein
MRRSIDPDKSCAASPKGSRLHGLHSRGHGVKARLCPPYMPLTFGDLDYIPIAVHAHPAALIAKRRRGRHKDTAPTMRRGSGPERSGVKARGKERRGGAGPRPLIVALGFAVNGRGPGASPGSGGSVNPAEGGLSTLAPPRRSLSLGKAQGGRKRDQGRRPRPHKFGRRSVGFIPPRYAGKDQQASRPKPPLTS